MARADERPVDDAAGPLVAAHRVDGDTQVKLPAASYQPPAAASWKPEAMLLPPRAPGGLCSTRSAGTPGAAPWLRGTADRRRPAPASAHRACGASPCASSSAGVSDWASTSPSLGSTGP